MTRIRVLIADDHLILRAGLRMLVNTQHDMEVVGEAGDGPEALRMTKETRPDVVLFDLTMPQTNAPETIARLARKNPPTRVVVLTMHDDPAYVDMAMVAGALGYVVKTAADSELLSAIRRTFQGRQSVYVSRQGGLFPLPPATKRQRDRGGKALGLLSPRETQVLMLLARGHTGRQIAERLQIGVKTVETFRSRLSRKLGLRHRADLVRYALETGLLSSGKAADEGPAEEPAHQRPPRR